MKHIFRAVTALAIVFAGCTNNLSDEVATPDAGSKRVVTAGIDDTRTYLGELVDGARKVYWSDGDQIAINGEFSSANPTISEDRSSATFEFATDLELPYSVLYPAEMYKDATTITLPAIQESATNTFAEDSAPMVSYQSVLGRVRLQHLAAVIRLQVKLPAESTHASHSLYKVEVKGVAGEQMSGDFAIDYEAATLTSVSVVNADKVVTAKVGKSLSADESTDIFVVVPAREYAQGITIRLIDSLGHYMNITSKALSVEAGEIKAMPVVKFVPTGTIIGVEL